MGSTRQTDHDAYRNDAAAVLAGLARPRGPRVPLFVGPSEIDLGAAPVLAARFGVLGARVEETWHDGAIAARESVVLAASVVGVADDLLLGTAYPRTRGVLRASIPAGVGSVVVVPRQHASVFGWAARVGLVQECVVDESAAREAFFIRGAEDEARALLTPDVTAAILALGPLFWRLAIGDGVVELSWRASRFDAEVVLPAETVEIVVTIARASVSSAA